MKSQILLACLRECAGIRDAITECESGWGYLASSDSQSIHERSIQLPHLCLNFLLHKSNDCIAQALYKSFMHWLLVFQE